MSTTQVISNYESLQTITSQMREAAVQGEWDKLIALEHQCTAQVAVMRQVDAENRLDEASRQRKISLIKQIMSNDAVIRNRTETWVEQLQGIMHCNTQEMRLQNKYSAGY